MRNRLFHTPKLHTPARGAHRGVGWLELFYDLIFVATLIQLGNALSHHTSLLGFLAFAGLFTPVWLAWTGFTFYVNRFVVDDFVHRFLVFLQMSAIGAMAVSVGDAFNGHPEGFALAYAGARVALLLLYVRVRLQLNEARELTTRWIWLNGADAALWFASAFVPQPWTYVLWAIGIGSSISGPLSRVSRELALRYPPDVLHMSERYGLLTIIVLGESFVKVLSSLSEHGVTANSALMCGLTLVITCCIWWIYFDDVAGSRIKRKRLAPFIWIYMHLPLTLAVTGLGVAIKKALFFDPGGIGASHYRWLLCGTLSLAFFSVAVIDWVTERRQAELSDRARVNVRLGSSLFILLLAPTGKHMSAALFVGLASLVCVAQVVFDLLMAPQEADPHDAQHDAQDAMPAEPPQAEPEPTIQRRYDISEAVRKGTPNELRRDLYFFLMEGSWTRLIVTLLATYLFINTLFAALYLLEPGSISNMRERSFFDAFYFSVQTMSTIGYGTLAPLTDYANVLVTIEAALGLLGVALATGLMFAKASRPRASVLFSDVCVVTERHGERSLMFRVGNGRGNEVVDASITVTVLIDEVSPEGHKMRRLHDMSLMRARTPLFMLSWSVVHAIDADSPLAHVDWTASLTDQIALLVVTLTGHDGTYAQTIYARHVYYPEQIRYRHRFVDVIHAPEAGPILLDFTHFHETVPEDDG